jgi:hypothetical protein
MLKRLLPLLLFALWPAAHAQVTLSQVPCIVSTGAPCQANVQVGNGAQGAPNWQSFGILNADMLMLQTYLNGAIGSLGTVTTGTWQATTIAVPFGGTGVQSISGVIKGNGTNPFTAAAASDVWGLFGCGNNANLFLNGAGGCTSTPGSGTVTSYNVTVPSPLTATGCSTTSAATCALSWTTGQTANMFLATPNGSTGAVALRTIVAADLPATQAQLTTASNLTTVGAISTGTWNGSLIQPIRGGTGVANSFTLTLNGQNASFTPPPSSSGKIAPIETQVCTGASNNLGACPLTTNATLTATATGMMISINCASACTITIPITTYSLGTVLTFFAYPGSANVTIHTGDTSTLVNCVSSCTGDRTLVANTNALYYLYATATWTVSGNGVT